MMRSPLRKGGQLARCDAGRERGHADAEHPGGLAQRDEGAGLGALDRGHGFSFGWLVFRSRGVGPCGHDPSEARVDLRAPTGPRARSLLGLARDAGDASLEGSGRLVSC